MTRNITNRLVDINTLAQEDVRARCIIIATTFTLRFLLGVCGNEGGNNLWKRLCCFTVVCLPPGYDAWWCHQTPTSPLLKKQVKKKIDREHSCSGAVRNAYIPAMFAVPWGLSGLFSNWLWKYKREEQKSDKSPHPLLFNWRDQSAPGHHDMHDKRQTRKQ